MSISALSGGAYPVVENKRLLKLEQDCLNVADQIIVPSFFVKKGLTEHNNLAPDKISVVPFGVDFKKFFSVRKRNMQKTGLKFLLLEQQIPEKASVLCLMLGIVQYFQIVS